MLLKATQLVTSTWREKRQLEVPPHVKHDAWDALVLPAGLHHRVSLQVDLVGVPRLVEVLHGRRSGARGRKGLCATGLGNPASWVPQACGGPARQQKLAAEMGNRASWAPTTSHSYSSKTGKQGEAVGESAGRRRRQDRRLTPLLLRSEALLSMYTVPTSTEFTYLSHCSAGGQQGGQ